MALRCLIVDDSERFIDAARALLERQGMLVVGTAENGDDAVELSRRLAPDVILLDIELGTESGFDVAQRLAQAAIASTVIFISTHAELDYLELIARSPAVGFLPKVELSASALRDMLARSS